ncbi:hypothetical protein BKA62DRAFT_713561 [Auriculariales sp. MPI-PUGE-AT-0066]|nr:hypothetical protein BKA62DRAFT_713561 [Auriculariales sp. MPI-PUGE-AT-0066]
MAAEPEFVAYPHTPDFKNFVKSYQRATMPSRGKFFGTVKLHGTNATVAFRKPYKHSPLTAMMQHFQSRNRNITAQTDNCGTVAHLGSAPLVELVNQITKIQECGVEWTEILVVGEIAGIGVQKGVAVAHVARFFAIFNIRIDDRWVDMRQFASVSLPSHRIYNAASWPSYEMDIDLAEDMAETTEKLFELTNKVTSECPVGLLLQAEMLPGNGGRGPSKTGEGVVWTMVQSLEDGVALDRTALVNFKVKGEEFFTTRKQATAKPQPGASTDEVTKAEAFAQYALGERRFEQGIEFVQDHLVQAGTPDESPYQKRLISTFCRWVVDDAMREEELTWIEMGVVEARGRQALFAAAKTWFFAKCDER